MILGLLRAGATPEDAAEAAGVPARTMREWIARGEGRSKRKVTPELASFAKECRKAQAEAKASAKARVHQRHPEKWLDHDGYRENGDVVPTPTAEELLDLVVGLLPSLLRDDPRLVMPRCLASRCRCMWHRPRTPEEQKAIRVADPTAKTTDPRKGKRP